MCHFGGSCCPSLSVVERYIYIYLYIYIHFIHVYDSSFCSKERFQTSGAQNLGVILCVVHVCGYYKVQTYHSHYEDSHDVVMWHSRIAPEATAGSFALTLFFFLLWRCLGVHIKQSFCSKVFFAMLFFFCF